MTGSKRRTLDTAMDMSDEKMAFIKGGLPSIPRSEGKPMHVESQIESTASQETKVDSKYSASISKSHNGEEEPNEEISAASTVPISRRSRVRSSRRELANPDECMPGMANLLIPLTTRLTPPTATALKRAGLEQKLYGRKPSTLQEIVEVAIKLWLDSEGYL